MAAIGGLHRTFVSLASPLLYRRVLFPSVVTKLGRRSDPSVVRKNNFFENGNELFQNEPYNKVSVVGCGEVGMACAFSILTMRITREMALVDVAAGKVKGEMMDLQHGSVFLGSARIEGSADYKVTANSKVCIVTAGVRQKKGETRLDLVQRNADLFKKIIPPLVMYSPNCILLIVSNPVDVLTYVVWKLSGFPVHRVIGSGTNLDSSRFRVLLAQLLRVAPGSVHGWIIGEHGDSSVPVWSNVNVAGVRLRDLSPEMGGPNDPENWEYIHKQVVDSGCIVRHFKGHTSWGVALNVTAIIAALILDTKEALCVSSNVKGCYGLREDVFCSLPCIVGRRGVERIIQLKLTEDEKEKFLESADIMSQVISEVKL